MSARTKTLWTFVVTSVALFMATLDNLVVTTALPVIRTDLGASIEDLEWTVNAFTLTFAVFLLTGAALGEVFFLAHPPHRPLPPPARPRAPAGAPRPPPPPRRARPRPRECRPLRD